MSSPSTFRVPPHLFLIGSGFVQYFGAAIAIGMFAKLSPGAVAWWRTAIAAAIFLAWRRPWRDGLTVRDLGQSAFFGVVMTIMNITFYEAIARLPLGTAVSLEFVGPVTVALTRSVGWRPKVAAVLMMLGVASIGGLGIDLSDATVRQGVAWILVAAVMWALYIVSGQKIATKRSGITNLSLGATMGALLFLPVFAWSIPVVAGNIWFFVALAGVAFLSTVVPYSFEALAMSRVSASTFALLASLLPASSTIMGALLLRQIPSLGEFVGLILISFAVALSSRN